MQTADWGRLCRPPRLGIFFLCLLFFSFFYLGLLKVCLDKLFSFSYAYRCLEARHGTGKNICIMSWQSEILEEFLGSASLENSKQCDQDVQFLATVSLGGFLKFTCRCTFPLFVFLQTFSTPTYKDCIQISEKRFQRTQIDFC